MKGAGPRNSKDTVIAKHPKIINGRNPYQIQSNFLFTKKIICGR